MTITFRTARTKLKGGLLRAATALSRIDRSGKLERRLQGRLIQFSSKSTLKVQNLAWVAEQSGDFTLAIIAWKKLMELTEDEKSERKSYQKALRKIVGMETKLRRQIEAFSTAESPVIVQNAPDVGVSASYQGMQEPSVYMLRSGRIFLDDFWQTQIGALSPANQTALRRAYCDLAIKRGKSGTYFGALKALQPVLGQWPEYQTAYRLFYKIALDMIETGEGVRDGVLESWWAMFRTTKNHIDADMQEQIWTLSERFARKMVTENRPDEAETVIMLAYQAWPEKDAALPILAQIAECRNDWTGSATYWQLYAAISNPITTKSRTHVAENAEEMLRKSKYALNKLRGARLHRATELHAQGSKREFNELVCRIVESLPDQRVFKNDRQIIDAVRTYVHDALTEDSALPKLNFPDDDKPIKIAICLDVLKISDVHTHARVVFAMCRNLMSLDSRIETHIIITNERFAVTTPVVSASFSPNRNATMQEAAKLALPEFYGDRFFLHNFKCIGLEGIINTCKEILDIKPHVMLFGGGHKGMFSNESRVIRHCLFDRLPTAFFYIQANNEVDDKLDMIITRGPHMVIGDSGKAKIRTQPYPTIVEDTFVNEVPINLAKMEKKIVVSAITGVRMDVLIKSMDAKVMKNLLSLLDRVPGTVWHMFGSTDPEALIKDNPQIKKRVKAGQVVIHPVVPFEEFTAFVGNASLFFHLPGITGGSGGATVARRGGIPIVTFKHSDVSGRQPESTIFDESDVKSCVIFAARLLKSRTKWTETVEAQFAHTNWIRKTSAQGFYDCLTETVKIGRKRLGVKAVSASSDAPRYGEKPRLSVVKNAP